MVHISHKIELHVNNKFKTYCDTAFEVARISWNWGLSEFLKALEEYKKEMPLYEEKRKSYIEGNLPLVEAPQKPRLPSVYDLKKSFNIIKQSQYPVVNKVSKYAAQQPFIQLGHALRKYYDNKKQRDAKKTTRKVGFPKPRVYSFNHGSFYIGGDHIKVSKGKSNSLTFNNSSNAKDYVWIPNFGWVKLKENLRFNGHIDSVTITQKANRYFISFELEITDGEFTRTHSKAKVQHDTASGIDLGLDSTLVTSDGISINAPKPLGKNLFKVKRTYRNMERKRHPTFKGDETKKSKNYIKATRKLAILKAKIANKRKDFTQKATTVLINNYDNLCIESLNVNGMMKNRRLARYISDVSFSDIKYKLLYKAEHRQKTIYQVDRFYPSSKTCCKCGFVKKELPLSTRVFICEKCQNKIDRDVQAAINLRDQIKVLANDPSLSFKTVNMATLIEQLSTNELPFNLIDSNKCGSKEFLCNR